MILRTAILEMDPRYKHEYCAEAVETIKRMSGTGCGVDIVTYNTSIIALCKEGWAAETEYILDEMIRIGEQLDVVTYTSLTDGYFM